MTRDEIIKLAREAGLKDLGGANMAALERFAALVAAAEREAWSNACDSPTSPSRTSNPSRSWITEHWIALQPSAQGGQA